SVRLVLTPERVVVAETRRTLTALGLQGIRVDGVIANRLVPKSRLGAGVAARWMRTRRAEQEAVLADVRAAGDEPLRTVEHRACEPVGLPALLQLADALYGGCDPLAAGNPDLPPLLSVTGGGRGARSEYQLRITVPLQPDADLDLARVADDLAITIDGRRRLVALPAVLRRCVVTGAESDEGGLVVRFRPKAEADTDTDATAKASDQGKVAR
ncbi:MAG: ArsA family ATPase, partial [Sciscionella sp.]